MATYGTSAGRAQGQANAASFGDGFTFVLDRAALDKLLTSEQGPVGKELARRGVMVDRAAKQGAPVDTGRLRASITWRLGKDSRGLLAIIGTNVEYAAHVEFGHKVRGSKTKTVAARPFLRQALMSKGGGPGTVVTGFGE